MTDLVKKLKELKVRAIQSVFEENESCAYRTYKYMQRFGDPNEELYQIQERALDQFLKKKMRLYGR